jgi:hypothetical protein
LIDGVRSGRRHHGLAHVEARSRIEHLPALGQGHHADRVRQHLGGQRGAVDRVHRDVHLGTRTVADLLAVVQHRGVVLLALPDHHDAAHRHGAEHRAHGVDRGGVDLVLVATAEIAGGGHGSGLGGPDQLHGQVPIRFPLTGAGRSRLGCRHR